MKFDGIPDVEIGPGTVTSWGTGAIGTHGGGLLSLGAVVPIRPRSGEL